MEPWINPDVWLAVFYGLTVVAALLGKFSRLPNENQTGPVAAFFFATCGNTVLGAAANGSLRHKAMTAFWAELAVVLLACLPSFWRYLRQDPLDEAETDQSRLETTEMPHRHLNPT